MIGFQVLCIGNMKAGQGLCKNSLRKNLC